MKTHLAPPTRDFNGGEFALVIALAFGLAIVTSLSAALTYSGREVVFSDDDTLATIVFELVVGAVIWIVLRTRGWKLADFAIHPSKGSTILGIILALMVLLAWVILEAILGRVPNASTASLPAILAISVVNPLFEEILVLGYVVQAMHKRFGLNIAINVSLIIRLAYHLYQGPLAVIPIALFGLVVTLAYVRLGRLWPPIVAHALLDFAGLSDWV